jgi:O-antigen/teichoic acid export membrane protein
VLGVEATPIFVLTRRSWDLLKMLLERISVAFMPGLAHLHGEKDSEKYKRICQRLLRVVSYATAIGVGAAVCFNKSFMSLWVGSHLYAGTAFDFAMAGAMFMIIFTTLTHYVLYASGNIKGVSIAGVLSYVARVIFFVLLIWWLKFLGSPVSYLLGFCIASIIYYGPRWISHVRLVKRDLYIELLRFLKIMLLTIALAISIRQFIIIESWLYFIIYGAFYVLTSAILFYICDRHFKIEVATLLSKLRVFSR